MSNSPKIKVETGDSAERRAFRTRQISRIGFVVVLIAAISITLITERGRPTPTATPTAHKISIVASTSVWGDIAKEIGGNLVNVTSLIHTSTQDPHSYEATVRDRLAVSQADIVISNGGGYDDYMKQLIAEDKTPGITIDAFQAAGDNASRNEHIWYDFTQVADVASVIASSIESVDSKSTSEVGKNLENFKHSLESLTAISKDMMNGLDNQDIVETEPVADYLLMSMGFHNVTPPAFTKAIEEGRDIPPLALKDVQDRIKYAKINFLAMNSATITAQTNALANQCLHDGVAVLYFSELPPETMTYIEWMNANIQQVRKLTGIGQ